MQVILAQPGGFCAGVVRAIEIVHNRAVAEGLRVKGAIFVEEFDQVPPQAVTAFSAQGVAREVEGTMGQIDGRVLLVQSEAETEALGLPDDTPVAYVTQTTLSVDDTRGVIAALQRRFSDIVGPNEVLLVVGATNSSNSKRLREIGTESGIPGYLLADGSELDPAWVAGAHVVDALRAIAPVELSTMDGLEENVEFKLLPELTGRAAYRCRWPRPTPAPGCTNRRWKTAGSRPTRSSTRSTRAACNWRRSAIPTCRAKRSTTASNSSTAASTSAPQRSGRSSAKCWAAGK
jgi:4-hydroxy-3-methylbut-2-enyl diphosphate reductase